MSTPDGSIERKPISSMPAINSSGTSSLKPIPENPFLKKLTKKLIPLEDQNENTSVKLSN